MTRKIFIFWVHIYTLGFCDNSGLPIIALWHRGGRGQKYGWRHWWMTLITFALFRLLRNVPGPIPRMYSASLLLSISWCVSISLVNYFLNKIWYSSAKSSYLTIWGPETMASTMAMYVSVCFKFCMLYFRFVQMRA